MKKVESYEQAVEIMEKLYNSKQCKEYVAVFAERGRGDDPSQKICYDIIVDGDGQISKGSLTREIFLQLRRRNIIADNSLRTYKARSLHVYMDKYKQWGKL